MAAAVVIVVMQEEVGLAIATQYEFYHLERIQKQG
jgi:hypothetical protein